MSGQLIEVDFKTRKVKSVVGKQPPTLPKQKLGKFEAFSGMVVAARTTVVLDATRPDVLLPEHLKAFVLVRIDWSHRFGLTDFEYDDRGVRGTLTFGGDPCFVNIPWDAVYGMEQPEIKGSGREWPESFPAVLRKLNPKPQEVQDGRKVVVKSSPRVDEGPSAKSFCSRLGRKVAEILGIRGSTRR